MKYSETFNKHLNTLQPVLRTVQFCSAIAGLIIWAVHLSRLPNNNSSALRAVLGVFSAGFLWVVIGITQYVWKRRNEKGNKRRWGVLVAVALGVAALDFCFVVLFAAAAGLTGPSSNAARGGGVCYADNDEDNDNGGNNQQQVDASGCSQVKGVFALSILSV